jgi:hypothetical protein
MVDLLELPLTKKKNKYLLVCIDLVTHEFDIEPLQNKEASTALEAIKKIFKREYVKLPEYSISTDAGSEFKSVFHKYFYDNNIYHKTAVPNRHSQQGPVEHLNRELGRLLNGYMNQMEENTGTTYREWDTVVNKVRVGLNKIVKKHPLKSIYIQEVGDIDFIAKPKYEVGDIVYYKSDVPLNALGLPQPTKAFRVGDFRFNVKEPKKIINVIHMANKHIPFRYMLEGMNNVSFTESQLMPAKEEEKESKYVVKKILEKRKYRGKVQYLIWFKKELRKEASWVSRTSLVEDGFLPEIKEFESNLK